MDVYCWRDNAFDWRGTEGNRWKGEGLDRREVFEVYLVAGTLD